MLMNHILQVALVSEEGSFVENYKNFSGYVEGVFEMRALHTSRSASVLSFKKPVILTTLSLRNTVSLKEDVHNCNC